MVFTAWSFAGMPDWSIYTLLTGGLLTFLAAVLPLPERWNGMDGRHGNRENLQRLLRFPFFWFSTLFLIYIGIQGFNTEWEQKYVGTAWYVEHALEGSYVDWLPTGVSTDYKPVSVLRVFHFYAAAFALTWGLWLGLRRRKTVLIGLWSFVVSGVLMSQLAIFQKYMEAPKVLWLIKSSNDHFWGSFFYRNHGVAFLILTLIACAFLYFYHYNKSERHMQRGGPYLLLLVFVLLVALSIALALSRGGILFGSVFILFFLLAAGLRACFNRSTGSTLLASLVVLFVLGGGAYSTLRHVDVEAIEQRFGDINVSVENIDSDHRIMCTKITWKMAQKRLVYGWGAGSWSYIFPMYQKSYPTLFYRGYHWKRGWYGRNYFHYAHNDLAQFLAEYGIVGCSLVVLGGAYWGFLALFCSAGNRMAALMLFAGVAVILGHAFVEFIFQSPAYWVALNGFACLSCKLLVLHRARIQRLEI
jgi:O-antigen ligase